MLRLRSIYFVSSTKINFVKNIVGKNIKKIRLVANPPLTQADLVARLQLNGWKISRGTLAKIEAGVRQVTDIELMKLSTALGLSAEVLLGTKKIDS